MQLVVVVKKGIIMFLFFITLKVYLSAAAEEIPFADSWPEEIVGTATVFESGVAFQLFGCIEAQFTQNPVAGYPLTYRLHDRFIPIRVEITNLSQEPIVVETPYVISELQKVTVPFSAFRNLCKSQRIPISTFLIKWFILFPQIMAGVFFLFIGGRLIISSNLISLLRGEEHSFFELVKFFDLVKIVKGMGFLVPAISGLFLLRSLWQKLPQKKDLSSDFIKQVLLEKEAIIASGGNLRGLLIIDGYKISKRTLLVSKYYLRYKKRGLNRELYDETNAIAVEFLLDATSE